MTKFNGGPAFPSNFQHIKEEERTMVYQEWLGMSLRDWFAGIALASLNLQAHIEIPAAEFLARSAYNIAAAMLKERDL